MEQRTPEWFAARAGKFTGSRFSSLMAKLASGKPAAAHENLLAELAAERIAGTCFDGYQNAAMLRGIELEAEAIQAYEDAYFLTVEPVAFVQHPTLPFVGCSPDGFVGDEGMNETKCPSAANKHLNALLNGSHAVEYKWQLQGQLWVCERQWVDMVSYDPRWPREHQLAVTRVYRDEDMIAELEAACIEADAKVAAIVEQLQANLEKAA